MQLRTFPFIVMLVNVVILTHIFFLSYRVSTCFAILSVTILATSTIFALVGHCVKGNKMLIASGLYAIGGKYYLSKVNTLYCHWIFVINQISREKTVQSSIEYKCNFFLCTFVVVIAEWICMWNCVEEKYGKQKLWIYQYIKFSFH